MSVATVTVDAMFRQRSTPHRRPSRFLRAVPLGMALVLVAACGGDEGEDAGATTSSDPATTGATTTTPTAAFSTSSPTGEEETTGQEPEDTGLEGFRTFTDPDGRFAVLMPEEPNEYDISYSIDGVEAPSISWSGATGGIVVVVNRTDLTGTENVDDPATVLDISEANSLAQAGDATSEIADIEVQGRPARRITLDHGRAGLRYQLVVADPPAYYLVDAAVDQGEEAIAEFVLASFTLLDPTG